MALVLLAAACGGAGYLPPTSPAPTPTPEPTVARSAAPTAAPTAPAAVAPTAAPSAVTTAALIERISPDKMWDHLTALTGVVSRDPRHPGHAKAQAYIKEQLGAMPYVQVGSHRFTYQGMALENILATIDPPGGAPKDGWIIVGAHYDSIAKATPGWKPTTDPAPGADDNATGTAALLEFARLLSAERASLKQRVVVAFWDGEEFFFKGSAAFVQALQKPYAYAAFVNIDMVGWNPVADRLDLIWYAPVSAGLRDRAKAANATYRIGVSPLVEVFAQDPNQYILDSAPFGLAGIPAITLAQRYGEADATFPGNTTFHTVNDTPDKITNRSLWLKAAKLTLAVVVELARGT
jgi:hypothetical protein